ncbi:MAG: hypothetical protein LWW95_01340 [Candidatus Desulfofervidus auxilii]|nr:hypothetical protein [Candidatus Desulfofervidus auxilii]
MEEWEYIFEEDYFIEGIRDAYLIIFFPGPKNQLLAWGETSHGGVDFPDAPPQGVLDKLITTLDALWREYSRFERPGCEVFLRKPYKTIHVEIKGGSEEDMFL